ncbi:MAG: FAD-dependent oxidoreductase [Deltaproteobacteria bacterium]|nr:FAD-dependent oxidoreductase [Deltaproteobacteria bacterium]
MTSTETLIVGAGLAGLSAAYHSRRADTLVVEKDSEVGGLCRSSRIGGFTFDHPGHVLHLKDAGVRRFLHELLPDAFAETERQALVYSHGVHTRYPFQVNTRGLPAAVIGDCVLGFAATMVRRGAEARDFKAWILRTFGHGIAQHFMLPYNQKLYQVDLAELEADWAAWSIPRPRLRQVVRGAVGQEVGGLGYNARFLYPKAGGIDVIARAIATRCGEIRLNRSVQKIDPLRRSVELDGGETVQYRQLISTMPLDALLGLLEPSPHPELQAAASRLRAVRVVSMSFGVNRTDILPGHWVYFPEPQFPFYRVGCPSNYAPAMAPRGCSALSVEVSVSRVTQVETDRLRDEVLDGLRRARVLRASDQIVAEEIQVLDPAYVIHDHYRREVLPRLLALLGEYGIDSIGRYGCWEYGSMESALRQGQISAGQGRGVARSDSRAR